MGSFQSDFEWNREHELILTRDGGISREELDEVELAMLENSTAPGLLPIEWQTWNGQLRFRYRLKGKKMLKHRLAEGMDSSKDFYSLMLGMINACDECRNYMLRADNILLDESYIFVGDYWNDIGLTYVPLVAPAAAVSLRLRLLSLAVRASAAVPKPDTRLASILQAIGDENIPLHLLSSLLLDAAARASNEFGRYDDALFKAVGLQGEEALTDDAVPKGVPSRQVSILRQHEALHSEEPAGKPEPNRGWGGSNAAILNSNPYSDQPKNSDTDTDTDTASSSDEPPLNNVKKKPNKWIFSAVIFAAAALPWKLVYMPSPGSRSLLICIGALAAAAGGMVWVWGAGKSKRSEDMSQYSWRREGEGLFQSDSGELDQEYAVETDSSSSAAKRFNGWDRPMAEEDRHLSPSSIDIQRRTDDSPSMSIAAASSAERTVWLGASQQPEKQQEIAVHTLIRTKDGSKERLTIKQPKFQIGRVEGVVDCVDSSAGVSRIHLELEISSEGCQAKDLGSRNGSLLNGRTMIPYKKYKLENEDILQLAGAAGASYEYIAPS